MVTCRGSRLQRKQNLQGWTKATSGRCGGAGGGRSLREYWAQMIGAGGHGEGLEREEGERYTVQRPFLQEAPYAWVHLPLPDSVSYITEP